MRLPGQLFLFIIIRRMSGAVSARTIPFYKVCRQGKRLQYVVFMSIMEV